MNYRLRATDLCMADAMPFQQHHEARISGRDIRDVLTDELFLNVRNNLQVGDEVVICGYSDQTWRRLQQFVRVRIIGNSKDGVPFMRDGEVREVPAEPNAPVLEKPQSRLEVVRGLRCFNVVNEKGAVLESFRTKKEAEDWAAMYELA